MVTIESLMPRWSGHASLHGRSRGSSCYEQGIHNRGSRKQCLGTNPTELETSLHGSDQDSCTMGRRSGVEGPREVEEGSKEDTIPEPEKVRRSTARDTTRGGRQANGSGIDRDKGGCNASTILGKEHVQRGGDGRTLARGL